MDSRLLPAAFVVSLITALNVACSTREPALSPREVKLRTITRALERMMERTNDDAFVIFEDEATERFVQFAGGKGVPLVLDLPVKPLTPEEAQRAKAFFSSLGVEAPDGDFPTYNVEFGSDAAKAAAAALGAFSEIYALDDGFSLGVEEN